MISEKIELLGKGLYTDIPDVLTMKATSTETELDYVGAEDFEQTMLDVILPRAVEEQVDFHKLLEIDFYWLCRCLRFLNFGPYFSVHAIYCPDCGQVRQEVRADLRTIPCKMLPDGFSNDIVLSKDDLIDYKSDIHLHLLTIQERINADNDKLFMDTASGKIKKEYARMCYMISSMGKDSDGNAISNKAAIETKLSPADRRILSQLVDELTDYGLRIGGTCTCPKCKNNKASFIAFVDDRFFRPSVGDIRAGRDLRSTREEEDTSGDKAAAV